MKGSKENIKVAICGCNANDIPFPHTRPCYAVELSVGRHPDPTWKRPPGRPRTKWTDQLRRANNSVPIATV